MTTSERSTYTLTAADRAVARKAHAILVLLGAKWGPRSGPYTQPTAANVTLEAVEKMVAQLLATVRDGGGIATAGRLIVSGDDVVGYDLSISIGELGA